MIEVTDPVKRSRVTGPPSGHPCGVDTTRGVWKAPANVALRGVPGLRRGEVTRFAAVIRRSGQSRAAAGWFLDFSASDAPGWLVRQRPVWVREVRTAHGVLRKVASGHGLTFAATGADVPIGRHSLTASGDLAQLRLVLDWQGLAVRVKDQRLDLPDLTQAKAAYTAPDPIYVQIESEGPLPPAGCIGSMPDSDAKVIPMGARQGGAGRHGSARQRGQRQPGVRICGLAVRSGWCRVAGLTGCRRSP